ncbi:GNAT family N-acetyltransferase [Corynebacterium confusum]|uniref:GNAT family N-acetyltransferase n=1 Tax=Corynebacterium confusum TaxID=71254 RepID=UPI00338E0935
MGSPVRSWLWPPARSVSAKENGPFWHTGAMENYSVVKQTDRSQFVITVDGHEAGYAHYIDDADVREFDHTVVQPDFQGQGLSKPLIQAALDDAREAGKRVRPTCSAVARFIDKNPAYKELQAGS